MLQKKTHYNNKKYFVFMYGQYHMEMQDSQ